LKRFSLPILLISGFLLSFSFAPYSLSFLSWFCLIPLFWIIENNSYKRIFIFSFLFGFVFYLSLLWWLYFLVVPLPKGVPLLLFIGVTLLCGYLSLYIAIFSIGTKYLGLFFSPLLWAVLEWIRGKSAIGFPWELLGTSQISYPPLIQFASFSGVYGVSAWIVWINMLLYFIIKKRRKVAVIGLLLSFILPLLYGKIRMEPGRNFIKVGVVQPNVSPEEKGDRGTIESLFSDLLDMTREITKERPSLLVYPETATLVNIERNSKYKERLQRILDTTGTTLITGTPLWDYEGDRFHYYNGAVLIKPHKGITQRYRKIKLVPFSERMPYSELLPFLKTFNKSLSGGDFSFGKDYTIFHLPEGDFAVLICFESIFPDFVQRFAHKGADFLVNITNDGWFGKTPGPYQHAEMALMRTVENGIPLIRCANNGLSLLADGYGRVLKRTGLFKKEILTGDIPGPLKPTFYNRYGNIFILISLISLIAGMILRWRGFISSASSSSSSSST